MSTESSPAPSPANVNAAPAAPECYVVNFSHRGRFIAFPARIVRETLSTITAQVEGENLPRTFNKRKEWRGDYANPRLIRVTPAGWGWRGDLLDERGAGYVGAPQLTFDVETVRERLAEQAADDGWRHRTEKLRSALDTALARISSRNPANVRTVEALETALDNLNS